MTGQSKPYPVVKDSVVAWLGKLPSHWEVRRLKNWLHMNQFVLSEDTDPDYVIDYLDIGSVGLGQLVDRPTKLRFGDAPSRARRIVGTGDTLVSTVRTYLKAVWHAENAGPDLIASTGFAVLSPDSQTCPKFVSYLCQSEPFVDRVTANSVGTAYPAISETKLASFEVGVPPLSEQAAIVRFLDHADDRIQRYIRAKEKLIALLEEQKQAVIHQAVTGQIDVRTGERYPAYKNSGVEFLGQVPEHWDVRRLGQIGTFSKGSGGNKDDEVPEGVPCIRYGDLYTTHKYFIRSSRSCVPDSRAADYTLIRFGDVLFAGSGETMEDIGKSAVNLVRSEVRCGGDIIVFRANREVEPEFLGYATDAPPAVAQKATMGRGFTVMHIYAKQLKRLALTLPPLTEQIEIARFLNDALAQIDAGMVAAGRQIRLARELRSSLTADVVTGKLDVREAASTLPGRQLTQNATSAHANP